MRRPRLIWLALLFLALGCGSKLYEYRDPVHKISLSYPGNINLITDQDTLGKLEDPAASEAAVDRPKLLFVMTTLNEGRLSCSLHRLPPTMPLSAEEYFQASTAVELAELGADVVEPKTDLTINGRTFQRVGFRLQVDELVTLHSRIYQYLDPDTDRVLVLTVMSEVDRWDADIALLEPVIESVRLDW